MNTNETAAIPPHKYEKHRRSLSSIDDHGRAVGVDLGGGNAAFQNAVISIMPVPPESVSVFLATVGALLAWA